jgi:hypothetical protein
MISGAADNYGEALFELTPTLPSRIWTELGGLPASNPNHLEIDAAFDRLRQTTTVEDRLGILQQFVQYWHGPIGREDGLAEEETRQLSIPRVLRWWYQWAGRRSEITTGQNMLLRPKDLISKDGKLVFYGENQWVYEWATLCNGDDPPVFGRYDEADPWEPENITLSEHLILAAIFEAVMCHSPYGASAAWLREDILSDTANHVPPIAINPWRWLGPTRFYGKNGAFMYSMVNGGSEGDQCYSVWVGAKTEEPLQFLRPFLSKDWDYVAI